MSNAAKDALAEFWAAFKNKVTIKICDIDELQEIMGKVFLKMAELEESRDNWREKYTQLKEQEDKHGKPN